MSWRTRPAASSSSPVLSDSEINTRRMGTRSVIIPPRPSLRGAKRRSNPAQAKKLDCRAPLAMTTLVSSTGAAELPADFAADARHLADDHQLGRLVGEAGAVDEQAFLDGQHRTPAAEVPRRGAAGAQDRTPAVGGE